MYFWHCGIAYVFLNIMIKPWWGRTFNFGFFVVASIYFFINTSFHSSFCIIISFKHWHSWFMPSSVIFWERMPSWLDKFVRSMSEVTFWNSIANSAFHWNFIFGKSFDFLFLFGNLSYCEFITLRSSSRHSVLQTVLSQWLKTSTNLNGLWTSDIQESNISMLKSDTYGNILWRSSPQCVWAV